jgi:hypothetical protein
VAPVHLVFLQGWLLSPGTAVQRLAGLVVCGGHPQGRSLRSAGREGAHEGLWFAALVPSSGRSSRREGVCGGPKYAATALLEPVSWAVGGGGGSWPTQGRHHKLYKHTSRKCRMAGRSLLDGGDGTMWPAPASAPSSLSPDPLGSRWSLFQLLAARPHRGQVPKGTALFAVSPGGPPGVSVQAATVGPPPWAPRPSSVVVVIQRRGTFPWQSPGTRHDGRVVPLL